MSTTIIVTIIAFIWSGVAACVLLLGEIVSSARGTSSSSLRFFQSLRPLEKLVVLPGLPLYGLLIGLWYITRRFGK